MQAFIAVGSNIAPETNIPAALEALMRVPDVEVAAASPFYRTPAVGVLGGRAAFLNGVLAIETPLEPRPLKFTVLRRVERTLGRPERVRAGPRTIDLDLVAHGDRVIEEDDLRVPDPGWLTRPFIAVPLAELTPALRHPVTGQTAAAIAAGLDRAPLVLAPALSAGLAALLRDQRPR